MNREKDLNSIAWNHHDNGQHLGVAVMRRMQKVTCRYGIIVEGIKPNDKGGFSQSLPSAGKAIMWFGMTFF